jgi:hypothetical protein
LGQLSGLRDDIIAAQDDNGGIVIGVDIGAFMSWQLEKNGSALLFRIALGSPTGAGEYFNTNSPGDRWTTLRELLGIEVKDWRRSGDVVLFCGQADRGWQYNNPEPFQAWFKKEVVKIRRHTDREIVFRPHPAAANHDHDWLRRHRVSVSDDRLGRNLYRVLANEWAMATFSSGAAVDSVVSGIPTFCASDECIARDVCNQDYALLESPTLFDRTQWLYDSAYTSWFIDEIREGAPLKRILDGAGV